MFSARPALPRPYGPVRPPEPSSTAQLQATLKNKCTAEWVLILKSCIDSSLLVQALEASQHPHILVEASLRKFSGGTLSQYLRAIRFFLTFVNQCVGNLLRLTLAHLSDFIAGCHVSQAEDRTALKCSAIMMSKALSWFARIGQVPSLLDLMGSPLIKSFAYNPKPHDRREALPLPLAMLAAWEEHIVSPACTPAVGLLLGALLLCAHCSLRFGDIERESSRPLCRCPHKHFVARVGLPRQPVRDRLALRFPRGKHQHVMAGEVACPAQPSLGRHSGRMGRFFRARLHSALHAKSGI